MYIKNPCSYFLSFHLGVGIACSMWKMSKWEATEGSSWRMELVNSEVVYPRLTVTSVIRFTVLQMNMVLYLNLKVISNNRFIAQIASSPSYRCDVLFFYLLRVYLYFINKIILFCFWAVLLKLHSVADCNYVKMQPWMLRNMHVQNASLYY